MVTVFTPCFKIEIDGIDRTRNIWQYLDSIQFEDAEDGESDSLSFSVANSPAFALPAHGAQVRFWLGWKETGMKYFGFFSVDECTVDLKPAILRVTAKSTNFNNSSNGSHDEKERRDREWENISLAYIAAKIGGEHGYSSKVEVDVHYPHIAQTGESNLSFLRRLAAEVGASFAIKDQTILIFPPNKASRPQGAICYSEAVSGSFTAKAREEYASVEAKWWDRNSASEKKVSSKRSKKEKWWHSAGGGNASGDGTSHKMKRRFHSASEAKTAADNTMAALERGEFEADLTLPGDPDLVAGAEISLSGFTPESLNGNYLAKSVSHSVSRSGWTTNVKLESLG